MNFFGISARPGSGLSEHPQTHTADPVINSGSESLAARHRTLAALSVAVIGAAAFCGPAAAQTGYTIAAARGSSTVTALRAPANARCELAAANPRAGTSLTAFSDGRGIVRFYVSAKPTARSGALATLECRSATAHTLVGVTIVAAPAAAHKPILPIRRATIADLQTNARAGVLPGTPAEFDVTRATDAQLAQLHYPRRPDAGRNALGYAIWRKLVTTPGAYVPAGAVADPKIRGPVARAQVRSTRRALNNATNFSVATSPNWSGVVINSQPAPFSSVWSQWYVPYVSTDGNYGASFSSTWVGMDGWGNNDVLQDGTEEDAWDVPTWGSDFTFQTYYAWYEFFPDTSYGLSNVAVSPGDQVFAESSAFIYPNGAVEGDYLVYDFTSNTGTGTSEFAPAGTVFSGASAEWVEERPTVNGGLWPMPDFDNAQMSSTAATSTDGNFYFADGSNVNNAADTQLNVIMTTSGGWSGDWLSEGYSLDRTDVGFHYVNWL